jgi:hypothetical protein
MLIAGIAAGRLFNSLFPSLILEYGNFRLFRPWSDPLMLLYFIAPLLLGFILSFVWNKSKHLFKEKKLLKRGFNFGIIYWIITIPGMVITYSSFKISLLMAVSWSASIFIQAVCAGIILAKMNK